jgi:hypothetical protein
MEEELATVVRQSYEQSQEIDRLNAEVARLTGVLQTTGALEHDELTRQIEDLKRREKDLQDSFKRQEADLEADFAKREAALQESLAEITRSVNLAKNSLISVQDMALLEEAGIYNYAHPLDNSGAYKPLLDVIRAKQKSMVKDKTAIIKATSWSVNNDARKGAQMVQQTATLMLRAYNAVADNCVRTITPLRRDATVLQLSSVAATIEKYGAVMNISISPAYHNLRVEELRLVADYRAKVEEEKQAIREQHAREQEERAAQADYERERHRLETNLNKERDHLRNLVDQVGNEEDPTVVEAKKKIADIQDAITGVEDRAANIKMGYVYVISNIGSFGEKMLKIGLTRRLEPDDRIQELSGASVPFRFDKHIMVFDADAVALEHRLHAHFADRRVNVVNARKEFFYVAAQEVYDLLSSWGMKILEFTEEPEALQWHQSENIREGRAPSPLTFQPPAPTPTQSQSNVI